MDVNELTALPPSVEVAEYEDDDYDEQVWTDLVEGLKLIKSAKTLLDYLSDRTLIKAISAKDRAVMEGLSERMRQHLCEVEPSTEVE